MPPEKECPICHIKFKSRNKFCSQSCANINANRVRHNTKISEDKTQRICSREDCELVGEYQLASKFYEHRVQHGGWIDSAGKRRCSNCIKCKNKRDRRISNTKNGFVANLVTGCKKRFNCDIDFDSTYILELWGKQNGKCALSGIEMTHITNTETRCNPTNASVDRIDNAKGYSKSNIQLVCIWVQNAKNDYDQEEFISWVNQMSSFQLSSAEDEIIISQ